MLGSRVTMEMLGSCFVDVLVVLLVTMFVSSCRYGQLISAQSTRPAFFVFGDSLVDSGNNNYLTTTAQANRRPYGIDYVTHRPTGRFSNGMNIPDIISETLGVESVMPYLDPSLRGNNLLRGANFASAGVGILNDTGIQFVDIIRMPLQLAYFREYQNRVAAIIGRPAVNRLVARSLVSITLGGNDYVNNYYLLPFSLRSREFSLPAYTQFIISEYKKQLATLHDLGARRIMVTGVGPMGCSPAERATRSRNGECDPTLQHASTLFNSQLRTTVNQLNTQFGGHIYTFADSFSVGMELVSNPQAYGFENARDACCGQGRFNGIGLCTSLSNLCHNRSAYTFWDSYHPSERACRVIAGRFYKWSLFRYKSCESQYHDGTQCLRGQLIAKGRDGLSSLKIIPRSSLLNNRSNSV